MEAKRPSMERGKTIVSQLIDQTVLDLQAGRYPNPLRGINHAATHISATLRQEGLNPNDFIMPGTIGDVDMRLPLQDPLEVQRFGHLPADMLLDPRAEQYKKAQDVERRILKEYLKSNVNIYGYDSQARGTAHARDLISREAKRIGIEGSADTTWMADGGMGALSRVFRTLHNSHKKQGTGEGLLLSPQVCFSMAPQDAADNGLQVAYVQTTDQPGQQINRAALERHFAEGGQIPDVMLLTPAENPTASSYEPEHLREVLTFMLAQNPHVTFVFDMAYMSMIPVERARMLTSVINETGAIHQSVFAFSESKRLGEPGLRVGAVIIPANEQLQSAFQADTIRNYPGFSWKTDVWFQVLSHMISQETLDDYYSLLRHRQYALLQVLRDLDPDGKYFLDLDGIAIPGLTPQGKDQTVQDNPLYLYVRLREGIDPLKDIAKQFGIFGVPGNVFGDQHNHMRFSLGVVSMEQILKRSPQTYGRFAAAV